MGGSTVTSPRTHEKIVLKEEVKEVKENKKTKKKEERNL